MVSKPLLQNHNPERDKLSDKEVEDIVNEMNKAASALLRKRKPIKKKNHGK